MDVRGGAIVTIVGDGFVDVGEGAAHPTQTYLNVKQNGPSYFDLP